MEFKDASDNAKLLTIGETVAARLIPSTLPICFGIYIVEPG